MSTTVLRVSLSSLALCSLVAPALGDEALPSSEPSAVMHGLAADGATSSVLRGTGDPGRGFVVATTSYDNVTEEGTVDLGGQVHLTGRFSLVLRVDDALSSDARPGIGAAVRLLEQGRHGVDSTGYLVYKTEGFAEPEGELEALAAFGRSFGAVRAVANVAYGQDPEGDERDGEVALGLQVQPMQRLLAGLVGRYRDALGSKGEGGVVRDVFGGASATVELGRFAVSGLAGVSGIETSASSELEAGVAASLSVGAAF